MPAFPAARGDIRAVDGGFRCGPGETKYTTGERGRGNPRTGCGQRCNAVPIPVESCHRRKENGMIWVNPRPTAGPTGGDRVRLFPSGPLLRRPSPVLRPLDPGIRTLLRADLRTSTL